MDSWSCRSPTTYLVNLEVCAPLGCSRSVWENPPDGRAGPLQEDRPWLMYDDGVGNYIVLQPLK